MFSTLMILLLPFIMIAIAIIIIVVIAIYTANIKNTYQEEAAFNKTQIPIVINDKTSVKLQYRMNIMDDFIRSSFSEVKSWKVQGDDSFHCMFFDNEWKNYSYVRVYFLDGTEKLVKILIDPSTNTLSLYKNDLSNDEDTLQKNEVVPTQNKETNENAENVKPLDTQKEVSVRCSDTLKDKVNAFLSRKDVFLMLSNEKNGTITDDLPENDVFEFLQNYFMEEFGAQLIMTSTGWSIMFT